MTKRNVEEAYTILSSIYSIKRNESIAEKEKQRKINTELYHLGNITLRAEDVLELYEKIIAVEDECRRELRGEITEANKDEAEARKRLNDLVNSLEPLVKIAEAVEKARR